VVFLNINLSFVHSHFKICRFEFGGILIKLPLSIEILIVLIWI